MDKEIIETKKGPMPKGQYSQIVKGGPFIFLSGQLPITHEGKVLEGDIGAQTRQILENIRNMLEEAGSSLGKVVKVGVYLSDIGDFGSMNDVYSRFFPEEPPARTTVEVANFPPGISIEIDAIALI